MATAENEQIIKLKLVVDKGKNKVMFAETDRTFVEILFTFLTMPLGTIVRLLDKHREPPAIGSLTSLYRGMASLDYKFLWTEDCKNMLLYPRNSAEFLCKKLKLNIDDTEPTRYYKPNYWPHKHLGTVKNGKCSCGYKLAEEVRVEDFGMDKEVAKKGGFLNADTVFIIKDDLQVFPASSKYAFEILKHLNDTDGKMLHTTILNIGLEEVLLILRMSLLTDSPLTNAFLYDQSLEQPRDVLTSSKPLQKLGNEEMTQQLKNEGETSSICNEIAIKLVSRKDENRVLYAEASEDFVDLLFSFLTYPLGAIEHLFDGHSTLCAIGNLYRSVRDLDGDNFIGSDNLKAMLISPKVATNFLVKNQLLGIDEVDVTPYLHTSRKLMKGGSHECHLTLTKHQHIKYYTEECSIIDPKSPEGSTLSQEGYVKGPATFMVSDDLKVTPFSSYGTISFLQHMNLGINDIEEHMIRVGKTEALSILKASLVSKSALTLGLKFKMKKHPSRRAGCMTIPYLIFLVLCKILHN